MEGKLCYNPVVSVIMPIRNEAAFIEHGLGAVLGQDYPHDRMEVIIADGMSTDETRTMIAKVARDYPDIPVTVLDSPGQTMPAGFNVAFASAHGDVIIIVGGHCEIAPNYVHCCVKVLKETGADCVGGPMTTCGKTKIARAIALAQSSTFGVGGVAFRTERDKAGYVDTVAFGAYRRQVFDRIGTLDEELVRNQDDEFNFRLTQAGGKIWLDPSIHSIYHSRANLCGLWLQYFQYGLYKVRVIQKRGAVPSWRHLVPATFVLALLGSWSSALVTHRFIWALAVIGPYAVVSGLATLQISSQERRVQPLLPLVFLILHLSYGLGFLWGLWRWRNMGS